MDNNFYTAGRLAQQEFMKAVVDNKHFMFLMRDAYFAGAKGALDDIEAAFNTYFDKIMSLYGITKP